MDTKKAKKKGINLIKKSNELIESRYKFDIWETRFFHSVLTMINKDDQDFETYRIYFRDIINLYELKPTSSYELLRNAAKSLMNQKVTINYEEEGHKREKIYHLIRFLDVLKEGRGGAKDIEQQEYIDVVIESEMRPFLLQLQGKFTTFDVSYTKHLGATATRIYEIIKQYEFIGHRRLYIDEMKRMMQMEAEYPKFSNYYQKVIAPSVRDINKYTDIKIVEIEKIKEGRKTVALHFRFEKQTQQTKTVKTLVVKEKMKPMLGLFDDVDSTNITEHEEVMFDVVDETNASFLVDGSFEDDKVSAQSEQDRLFMEHQDKIVSGFGVSPSVFIMELKEHTEEELLKAIRVTEAAIRAGKTKNNAAFFVEALRKGFTNTQEVDLKKRASAAEADIHNHGIDTEIEQVFDEQGQAVNDKIRELIQANPYIRDEAIVLVKSSLKYQISISKKEKELNRPLDIEDFRKDKTLVNAIKSEIINAHRHEFFSIMTMYEAKIKALQLKKK